MYHKTNFAIYFHQLDDIFARSSAKWKNVFAI